MDQIFHIRERCEPAADCIARFAAQERSPASQLPRSGNPTIIARFDPGAFQA
jgi:hypothetical protein